MKKKVSLFVTATVLCGVTQTIGAGDFNNNGHADILWQKDNSKHTISMMENAVTESTVFLGREDWTVQGIDDFNDDGTADILWQRDNGNHIIWMLKDGKRIKVTRPKNPTWSVQSTNDFFNHDGNADIIWKNADGDHVISEMVNGVQQSSLNLGNSDWSVQSTDDFNGDGYADILWKNADGDHEIWEMIDGVQQGESLNLGNPDWSVKSTDDFNTDGYADILWRNPTNGYLEILMMIDGEAGTPVSLGNPYMCVQGTDDFNDDGYADILWKNIESGDHEVWMMNDGEMIGSTVVVGNPDWTVQPASECVEPPHSEPGEIIGSTLDCETGVAIPLSDDAGDFNSSDTFKQNISSRDRLDDPNRENPTSHNTIVRLGAVVPARDAEGTLIEGTTEFHPIAVSYTQQYLGDYEMGDGSADIGDPENVDAVFFAMSQDNGQTWKNMQVTSYDKNESNEANKSSITVDWNGEMIEYPPHAQKPTMAIEGNNIVVAWNDKFCPSGNPFDLEEVIADDGKKTYPDDYFAVNGKQGSINYSIDEKGDFVPYEAPNGKFVYEVPFSCVWTARGIFNDETGEVTWHAPMQLTTGTNDSNHIWVEGSEAGFAITWQEDTVGLKSGKGAGPGEGWSGATTNKGSDIWYSSIKMDDFAASNGIDGDTEKLKSLNNFHYPMRITDNEQCQTNDTKPYCNYLCGKYGFESSTTNNNQENAKERCLTGYTDMLDDRDSVLDGDTGASRPTLRILKTDALEYVVVFGYEETKALKERDTGTGEGDTSDTDISVEGKAVYFESFLFDAIDDFDGSNPTTMEDVHMPLVSSGKIVNVKSPDANDTSTDIYENARRLVIGTQVDSCDADSFNFVFMYKQSFEVQGESSDMFIRVNEGFTYDSFVPLDGRDVTNISGQLPQPDANATSYEVDWIPANLDDYTYVNPTENTFSPRIFLRGNSIYTGFEYKPVDVENFPANFHTHIYDGDTTGWRGPVNITKVTKESETTVDARFFTTPKGSDRLDSDQSNPEVLFVTWGNIDFIQPGTPGLGKAEGDLFYKRSTDNGLTWEDTKPLAAKDGGWIQEKEVESFASPDGKTIYNVWLQEQEDYNASDPFSGLDSWFGRVDYDINIVEPDPE